MTQPYTAADVEVAELALCRTRFWLVAMERSVMSEDDLAESARAVLSALAAAGRLTPADAETRTEWAAAATGHGAPNVPDPQYATLPAATEREARAIFAEWRAEQGTGELRLVTRQETRFCGPWLPVPEEDSDAHTS